MTEQEREWLAARFEEHRPRLRGVAYRMLGSLNEAEDAVQDAWLRLSRSEPAEIENLGAWLTTVVARVCLNMLRSRNLRREQPLEPDVHVPDPVISRDSDLDPETSAVLADSVGLALLVVLETLTPAERLAFVLHDMFGVPFEDIAKILGRSPMAARQLASRARRRVQGRRLEPDADLTAQRTVVDAFFAAARRGDFEGLVAVLDPEAMLRSDGGALRRNLSVAVRGAEAIAANALRFADPLSALLPIVVNGGPGVVAARDGKAYSLMAFTVRGGKILEIDAVVDPERLRSMGFAVLEG